MGVSIEQWRCAIASAAPLLRVTKKEEKHDGMLRKMRDDSFKLWSFVGDSHWEYKVTHHLFPTSFKGGIGGANERAILGCKR